MSYLKERRKSACLPAHPAHVAATQRRMGTTETPRWRALSPYAISPLASITNASAPDQEPVHGQLCFSAAGEGEGKGNGEKMRVEVRVKVRVRVRARGFYYTDR